MAQADWVQSVKFASFGTSSNEVKFTTVTFLFKFQTNKRLSELSESFVTLYVMIKGENTNKEKSYNDKYISQ